MLCLWNNKLLLISIFKRGNAASRKTDQRLCDSSYEKASVRRHESLWEISQHGTITDPAPAWHPDPKPSPYTEVEGFCQMVRAQTRAMLEPV